MQKYLIILTFVRLYCFFSILLHLIFHKRVKSITKITNALKTKINILAGLLLLASTQLASAQSGTNSPYSQFGLGMLSDQSAGFSRGMDGAGIGYHVHIQVNYLKPGSDSSLDSLSFIFDAG